MTVPTPAFIAAAEACPFVNRDAMLRILEAAAPLIAAAERDRIVEHARARGGDQLARLVADIISDREFAPGYAADLP